MTRNKLNSGKTPLASLDIAGSELVLGLVGAVGTDLETLTNRLDDYLRHYGYAINVIRLSKLIRRVGEEALQNMGIELVDEPQAKRLHTYMNGGNALRKKSGRNDFLALQAVNEIAHQRGKVPQPLPRKAHVFRSLKRPEEVALLRKVYGSGFFLIAAYMPEGGRLDILKERKNICEEGAAEALIERDEREHEPYGQQTRETFRLADVFVDLSAQDWETQLRRFLDLLFRNPHLTPNKTEHAMFLAHATSLRSADLSRQVGAVIATSDGEVLATGANDVPSPNGGLYWPDGPDVRDYVRGFDSNEKKRDDMILEIMKTNLTRPSAFLCPWPMPSDEELLREGQKVLAGTSVFEVTEFGRSVHAEMEALLACARNGTSPQGAELFTTTFPCHNCARHIIAAGITKVVYIEPYPKSKAPDLHSDALDIEGVATVDDEPQEGAELEKRVSFKPFVGVSPRRYTELFSMNPPTGERIARKQEGKKIEWQRNGAVLRAPMAPTSYLDREEIVSSILRELGEEPE